jgi:hypothetical protein
MASNKIHLGNTKIVSDSEAPEGTVIATPTKSGTIALLSDVGEGASPVDTYTKTEIDAQQAKQNHDIADNHASTQTNSNRITKNEEDIAALEARPIGGETVDAYTKDEVDAQQNLQDIEIAKNAEAISNIPAPISTYSKDQIDAQQKAQDDVTATKANKIDVYTKAEVDAQQAEQDAEIVKKADAKDAFPEAPEDGETYARNNKTWVSISETSGIPDAPVDGKMYGRKDGEWDAVADAGDIYTKAQIDSQQSAQDTKIDKNKTDIAKNTADIAAIPAPVDAYTKAEVDASQLAQDTEIAKKADKETTYTKAQIDSQQSAQDVKIDKNIDDIQTNADAIAAIPAPIDSYTKAEVDASQNEQDTEILKKADKADVYTKTEMDTQQSAQDTKIDKNVSDVAKNTADITKYTADVAKNTADITKNTADIAKNTADIEAMPPYVDAYTKTETNTLLDGKADKGDTAEALTYKGSINATNTGAPVDANIGDLYINDFNPAEPNKVYPVAEYGDWGMVTEVKYNDKLIKVAGGWDRIEAPQIPDGIEPIDAYTKDEVDASQKVQDDAIAKLQNQNAPWEPHDYLYVNNCVPAPAPEETGTYWDTFVAPQPGEIFFVARFGHPLEDDNYSSIETIFISKYDKKGNELPFKHEKIYNEETGELEFISYDVYGKELKLNSPNGSATYFMEGIVDSDTAPEHVGYEGEPFYVIQLDTYESEVQGTITEGEIAQVTSPEDKGVSVDWKLKEYASEEKSGYPYPPVKISSATINNDTITINKLSIGASLYHDEVSNIMIGSEPSSKAPWWADDYLPGLHWNAQDSGFGESSGNIAIGRGALGACQTISENTAIGFDSLTDLRNGWSNTAIGYGAGQGLQSGQNNTFIGYWAGPKGPDAENANNQVVLGHYAAEELWVGNNKVFPFPDDLGGVWEEVGSGFGRAAVTQVYGLGIGTDYPYKPSGRTLQVEADGPTRLILNNTKANMMVIKADDPAADSSNQGGGIVISDYTGTNEAGAEPIARFNSNGVFVEKDLSANRILVGSGNGNWTNTRIGSNTFKDMDDSAVHNTAVGRQALLSVTNGIDNVAVGSGALQWTREGSKNVGIGHEAGLNITTGINNTCIGYAAQPSDPKVSNEVTIGNDDVTTTRLKGTVTANGTPLTTTVDVDTAIDKKLAIKDKLIEKLSARLDKLEKRMKK